MSQLLTRNQIIARGLPFKEVPVHEWGGVVRLQQMSVGTREAYLERIRANRAELYAYETDQALPEKKRAGLKPVVEIDQAFWALALCVVDDAGVRLFNDSQVDDFKHMGNVIVTNLWRACLDVNDLNQNTSQQVSAEKKG